MAENGNAEIPATIANELRYGPDRLDCLGVTPKLADEESRRLLHAVVGESYEPATDRLLGVSAWLTDLVSPHLDGPHPIESVLRGDVHGRLEHPILTTSRGVYYLAEDIPRHSYVCEAIKALDELVELEALLAKGGDIDSMVRLSIRLGMYLERIHVRYFGPPVLKEKLRRKRIRRRRKINMTLTTQQWLIVKAFIKERVKAGDSVAAACEQASAQLLTETVPNLSGAPIEISGMRLQTLYSRRKR